MESTHFDHLAGAFARKQTRRGTLRLLGLAIAGGAGLRALTASPAAVDAANKHRQRGGGVAAASLVSQHDFVVICKKFGGVPARQSTHVVKCTWGPGDTSTCNFDTGTCKEVLPYGAVRPAGANPWEIPPVVGGDLAAVAEPGATRLDPLAASGPAADGDDHAATRTSPSQHRHKHAKGHKH